MKDDITAPDGHPQRWPILWVLCLSLVMVVVAVSSLNVALPTLVRELGATASELQWIVDSYALVFAGLLLPAGALGDRFGRKGALQFGMVTFAVASGLSALADDANQLIATRALMGVGAAFVMPATLSILADVFPPAERAKAIAIWAGFAGAGGGLGPIASGLILEHWDWPVVFLINVPIAMLALGFGWRLVPSSRDPEATPLDPTGALVSIAGFGLLLFAIIEGPGRGWTDSLVIATGTAALVLLGAFVWWELRTRTPMLDPRYFRDVRFSMGTATLFAAFFAMFGMFFLLTQYLQFSQGHGPLGAGVRTLPMAVAMIAVAPRSAVFVERFGARAVVTGGLVILAIGLVQIARLDPADPYWQLAVGLVTLAVGMALSMPPATTAIIAALPPSKAGVASAVNDTTRELGGALGIAVLGSLMASAYRASIDGELEGLPPEAAEAARESVGAAFGVAGAIGGPEGAALMTSAGEAFSDAMSAAMFVGAVLVLAAAAVAFYFMPADRAQTMDEPVLDPVELP